MLEIARERVGDNIDLRLSKAEDLPFSDDEFDIVTIINALETVANPQKAIAEAIRVCRGRIFIGFLNNRSFVGTRQRLKEIFGFPVSEKIRFFNVKEIKGMVEKVIGEPLIKWGSVIYFPTIVYDMATELEELIPHAKNPLGAFTGVSFPINYTYRTAQSPILESYQLKPDTQAAAPEAIRGML
jgi:SAM-dependent methyltransferase